MITFILVEPNSPTDPGLQEIQISVSTDQVISDEDLLDSLTLKINEVEVEFTIEEYEDDFLIVSELFLSGPQTMKIEVAGNDGTESSDIFLLEVNPESFYRLDDYVYSSITPLLSSYFPEYTKAASDRYSIFQQLINPIALELEDTSNKLQKHNRGLSLTNISLDDPDWLYQHELTINQTFKDRILSDGSVEYMPPQIFGFEEHNKITLVSKSSFTEFWDKTLPSRFKLEEVQEVPGFILSASTEIIAAETIQPFSNMLEGQLFIEVHSAENLVSLLNGQVSYTAIQIEGFNSEDIEQTESVILLKNGLVSTRYNWSKVNKISLIHSPDTMTGELVIYSLPPLHISKKDPLQRHITSRKAEVISWELGNDLLGTYIDKLVSAEGATLDIAKGASTSQIVKRYRLADISNELVTISDCTLNYQSNKLYGLSSSKLYIWDTRDALPTNLGSLAGGTEDPELNFYVLEYEQSSNDGASPTQVISIELDRPRGLKKALKWHWLVHNPDGTTSFLDAAGGLIGEVPFWKENSKPVQYYGIEERRFELTLEETGNYIFELVVQFIDGTSEYVKRPYQFFAKQALAEYKIDHLVDLEDDNAGIYLSPSGELTIYNSNQVYKLEPVFDIFMIDPDERRILFREEYDQVEIIFNE